MVARSTILRNRFHNSKVTLRGTEMPHPLDGSPAVCISQAQHDRALRELCGIKGCCCERHQPHLEPLSNPNAPGGCDWVAPLGE